MHAFSRLLDAKIIFPRLNDVSLLHFFLDVYIFILHQRCVSTAMKNRMYCWSLVLRYCLHLPLPSPPLPSRPSKEEEKNKGKKKNWSFLKEETSFYNIFLQRRIVETTGRYESTCISTRSSVFDANARSKFFPNRRSREKRFVRFRRNHLIYN